MSTSKAGARVGGLSASPRGRRGRHEAATFPGVGGSSRSTANAVGDTATPHFEFTGQPSGNTTVAVTVLRAVGAVTDFLGIDFGTQIAPLMAFDHPPSFTVSGLDVQCDDFAGQPVYVIRSGSPSGKYVVALHGGAYMVQPTINHWSAYAAIARRTEATVIVPIYPLASTSQGRAQTVIPDMADLISARITQHGANNVSVYGDSAGGAMALAVAQLLVRSGEANAVTHGSHFPMARRNDEQSGHRLHRRPRVEDGKSAESRPAMGWRSVSNRSLGQPGIRVSGRFAADRCVLRKHGPARCRCASASRTGAGDGGQRFHLHPAQRCNS